MTFSSLDFSSDDEAGVFFGTPKAIERKIVASLSKTIPPSPASRDLALTAASGSPRSSSIPTRRVKKRDSREFLRRKTLLLSHSESPATGEKVWEGNFYEKDPAPAEAEIGVGVGVGVEASPSSEESSPKVNILDMTASLVTEENGSPASSSSSLDLDIFGSSDDSLASDFDKENTDVPEPLDWSPEPEYVPDEPENLNALTLGMREAQLIDLGECGEARLPSTDASADMNRSVPAA